jgi:hypothetical protein
MKYLLFPALYVTLLVSCSETKTERQVTKVEKSDALIIGDPIDCDLDSLLIFPLGSSYNPEVTNPQEELEDGTQVSGYNGTLNKNKVQLSANTLTLYDVQARVEYVNEQDDDYDIRNLLFYDMYSKETYPLMLDSLHILSFAVHKEYEHDMIFYRVVRNDFNDDEKYNSLDPVMLYISDLNGKNFTQITPEDQHFIDYTYYEETQSIMIKTVLDSDNNKAFLPNDETSFSSMSILEPAKAEEIFSDELKTTLRSYLK